MEEQTYLEGLESLETASWTEAIMSIPGLLHEAREDEATLQNAVERMTLDLARSGAELDRAERAIIASGYKDGMIGGKNESVRKIQRDKLVEGDENVAMLRRVVVEAENKLVSAKRAHDLSRALRRYVEDERNARMAVLRWREQEHQDGVLRRYVGVLESRESMVHNV